MTQIDGTDMLVLTYDELIGLVPFPVLITAVEAAARALEEGSASVPPRLHVEWDGNTLLAMPAVAGSSLGTKLVSVVPGNAARGLPVTNGLMVLNDGTTGLPVALLNAAALTAQRTGAVGAMGVKLLTPPDLSSVGIIGTGVQGAWQAVFVGAVRPIREVFALGRSAEGFEKFAATVARHAPGVRLVPCADVREVLAGARLIIAATTSAKPVLPDDPALLAGRHFISVGSYRPDMQELPDAVYHLAGRLALDSDQCRHEVGDVLGPVARGVLRTEEVFPIGQLLTGRRAAEARATTAYKTAGMALYDLFAAEVFYQAARTRGIGREVEI
jgi:ornithine cyclodeaminase